MTYGAAHDVEFRVLGPIEVRVEGESLPLGGGKQRAVLAVLLLHAGEPVSVDRLIDEVWGDNPPPSAGHSLEAYVSRLRQVLNGHGPALVRRGAGYTLELGDARLDARRFQELHAESELALGVGDHRLASRLAGEALALWRGPALPDVALASAGRVAAERLEELRLRTFEIRFDADLALGRHEGLVGELQALVGQNPYRERFVAQLMLALYRSGRQAEALEAYEEMRRRLDRDLGLQPSVELRTLSGQIVRQEPQLLRPRLEPREARLHEAPAPSRARRMAALVLAASVTASVMAFTASGSASYETGSAVASQRVALVVPRAPEDALDDPAVRDTAAAVREHAARSGRKVDVIVADDLAPAPDDIDQALRQLEDGPFALVLVLGDGAGARAIAPLVRTLRDTRFVFLDASLATLSLERVPNATGVPFADDQSSQLVGYASGLVPPRGAPPGERPDVVSVVAYSSVPRIERVVQAFARGARLALPSVRVRVDYVEDEHDKTVCEAVANSQVDAGSDVVFAVAGACSSSALAVAKVRGIWGIQVNDDGFSYGPHILATTYKRWDTAVQKVIGEFEAGSLPSGRDRVLTLADDYAVDVYGGSSPEVSAAWSKVVRLCSKLRQQAESHAP